MSDLAAALEPEVPKEEIDAANAEPPEGEETPEVKPEARQEEKPEEDKKERFVPHGAFHEERERRKQIQRENEQLKQQMAVFNDRLQQLYQAKQQEDAPQFRDPNTDPDPLAAMQHNMTLLARQNDEMRQAMQARGQQELQSAQQAQYIHSVTEWGKAQAAEFAQEAPDFGGAYEHMLKLRAAELRAMGFSGEQLTHRLHQDEFNVIEQSRQSGKNPARVIYEMAKATGYVRKQPGADQKIEQIQKGQGASKTLGNGSGGSGMPTPEQIAAMSEDDFAAFKSKLAKQGKSISDVL